MIRSNKIRTAARGASCSVNILGICNHNAETTVLAHLSSERHGMALKSCDLSSTCFACSSCNDVIDRRVIDDEFELSREWYLRRAQTRTLARLIERGIVRVA